MKRRGPAKIHIVTGAVTSARNIVKCANRAGLDVSEIVLESLASGRAVLSDEEKELGTALIDIGGGTTDLAIFKGKNIFHTFVLALGGDNFTNDIAIGLKAPLVDAERIKEKFGCCVMSHIGSEEMIEVPGLGGRSPRKLPRQILGEILEPRMEEIFNLVRQEIDNRDLSHCLNAGVVLTGGGSLIEGSNEIAESVFKVPARIAKPSGVIGLTEMVNNPIYATGVGLVVFGAGQERKRAGFTVRDKHIFKKVLAQMKRWFKDAI